MSDVTIKEKADKFDEIVEILKNIVPTCNNKKEVCHDEIVQWVKVARNVVTVDLPAIVSLTEQLKNKVDKFNKKLFKDSCDCNH